MSADKPLSPLDHELEEHERDLDGIDRFARALKEWERLFVQYGIRPVELARQQHEGAESAKACLNAFKDNYQGAARYIQRVGIDAKPLLAWVRTMRVKGVPQLWMLIEQVSIAAQLRSERLRKRVAEAGSGVAEGDQAAQDNTPRRRGRRRRYDPQRDREILEAWERARAAGVCKKDFAKDMGLSQKALNQLLNRARKARK